MSSHTILLVEDDEATRAFLAHQLTADGYEILLAHSRQHALHLLASHHPQLVLAPFSAGRELYLSRCGHGGWMLSSSRMSSWVGVSGSSCGPWCV